jgi:hypothetical protein
MRMVKMIGMAEDPFCESLKRFIFPTTLIE